MTEVLRCQNLSKVYESGPISVEVLQCVNFSIDAGCKVAIVGASGSGKSTLMHL